MKLSIYAFKDCALGVYLNPAYNTEHPEDAAESFIRQLKVCKDEDLVRYKHKNLYYFGTFDDVSGAYDVVDPQFLVSCDDIIASRSVNDEGK